MTFTRGCGRPRWERISDDPLGSLLPSESSHDEGLVNPPTELSVAKYTKENLQRIFRTVVKAQALPSDGPREKPLKARSPDVYRGKSHMECYNFCQQCEDHFATAGAKGSNRIPFAASFLCDRINFRWQQYKWKYEGESTIPIMWEKFKTFLCQSVEDSRVFIDSYWAKIKRDFQYQQEDVLDWAVHLEYLEHLQAVLQEFDSVAAPNEDTMIR